ncbi:MAG: sugar-binding protein, partial [Planctomycetota bacterium]
SVTEAGPLSEAVSGMSPETSKLVLINVGGMLGFVEADESVDELVAQLASSCDKTTIRFRTQEEQNNLNARVEVSGLPPVGQVIGPAMELAQIVSEAKATASLQERMARIPGVIRPTSQPPAIDGRAEELWAEICRHKIRNTAFSPASDRSDLTAFYRAMWDEDNLYVLVNVMDDVLKNDSDEFWLDDAVEVFIDADNSKSPDYGDNDYQYFFEWAQANPQMGEFKHGRITGVEFAVGRADVGYRVEIKFPWSTLGADPSVGAKIGLDVHVNDDDDGGDRDTKVMWRGKEDNAWQTPEALGTAELAGLVAWWKFDGNANDSSGNANHGTENGNPTYVEGKFGQAVSFDGKSDRIEVPATVAGNPELFPATAVSASAWVRTTVSAEALCSLVRHEFHFTPLQTFGGGARAAAFTDEDGSRMLHITSFDWSKINDGKWHHCAVTYDSGVHEVWIDGTRAVSDNLGPFPLWTGDNQPWAFGGRERGEGGGEYYPGQLDDVRLYSYALTEDEIEALHNEGK